MIEVSLQKKLRKIQAKKIKQTNKNYSFSNAINDVLRKGLKDEG